MIEKIIYSPASYEGVDAALKLISVYCRSAKKINIGKSVLNRKIDAIKIGDGENIVLYAGCFHPIEDLTVNLLLKFLWELSKKYESFEHIAGINIRNALEGRSVVIAPLINPDGLEIRREGPSAAGNYRSLIEGITNDTFYWNANARGVDINHNFDAGHDILKKMEEAEGIFGPAIKKYGGPYPESEPESRALCDFCRNNNVISVSAFHSQGEEIYYTYNGDIPYRSTLIAKILSSFSGYKLILPEGTASHGGFKDWFIKEFSRPGFTFEIGKGENPLPLEDLDSIYLKIYEALVYGIIL
ncbi:MAG: gamma-D-glutamyl-meso-diaminopimelate peptidase [Oscillospiraceae bacterium]|nr:gamma-D-glutamyl-meso-diaminopimelate peptidase [Oscillospiraceae bacterium]